jgi:tRNA(Ile)-lysidine synthase TilS/MesJ
MGSPTGPYTEEELQDVSESDRQRLRDRLQDLLTTDPEIKEILRRKMDPMRNQRRGGA